MKRGILIPVVLALLLFIALAPTAFAGPLDDTIIEANEVVNNDVIVLEGDVTVRRGAVVNGDVAVFSGDASVDGTITGSLTLFNGDLTVGEGAVVEGECVLLNGEIRGSGSLRNCTAVENLDLPIPPVIPPMQVMPTLPAPPAEPAEPLATPAPDLSMPPVPNRQVDEGMSFVGRLLRLMASTVLMTLLGLFVGLVMPDQLRRIVTTARTRPVASGLFGVLTAVSVPSLIAILAVISALLVIVCVGLLGFPIIILLALALGLGSFLGWVVMGTWLGLRLFGGKDQRIVRAAGLGTGTLTFFIGMLSMLPLVFGETVLVIAILSVGLGAVTLTLLETRRAMRQARGGTPGGGSADDDLDPDKIDIVLGTLPPDDISRQRA